MNKKSIGAVIIRWAIILVLIGCSPVLCYSENDIIIEIATGFGSEHTPFSSKWNGAVVEGGLNYREYAIRGIYLGYEFLSLSLTTGLIEDHFVKDHYIIPLESIHSAYWTNDMEEYRQVFYLIPTLGLSIKELEINLGAILYTAKTRDYDIGSYYYPFNGDKSFKPSLGIVLGEKGFYLFGKFFNSFPLYSGGGGLEIGLGGRYAKYFEQKAYFSVANHFSGIGYKGEFRISNTVGFIIGISVGWVRREFRSSENEVTMMLGFKTIL